MGSGYMETMIDALYPSCVLWQAFSRNTGTSFWDFAKTPHNGYSDVPATWDATARGSVDFNGSDQRIVCGDINETDGQEHLSVGAWVYYDSIADAPTILSKYTDGGAYWTIFNDNSNLFWVVAAGGTNSYVSTTDSPIESNVWKFVFCTFDGTQANPTNKLLVYVNGRQSATTLGDVPPGATHSDGNPVTIGSREELSQFFNGKMGEVLIFQATVSSNDQFNLLYNKNKAIYGL